MINKSLFIFFLFGVCVLLLVPPVFADTTPVFYKNAIVIGNTGYESHENTIRGYFLSVAPDDWTVNICEKGFLSNNIGGLVGTNSGTILYSFYDLSTSGRNDTGKGISKITAEMKNIQTFSASGWDIADTQSFNNEIWIINNLIDYPKLTLNNLNDSYTMIDSFSISSCEELQNINQDLSSNYILTEDIDCSDTINWNFGEGFIPLGDLTTPFTGSLDGNNYKINGLYINRNYGNYQGLFGYMSATSQIRNIGLVDVYVSGRQYVGGFAGWNSGLITNSYVTGSVSNTVNFAGGIAGFTGVGGSIINSHSDANVNGALWIGGLVGELNSNGNIINSYATGKVTGGISAFAGGLVGQIGGAGTNSITYSYATGNIISISMAGGLVAQNDRGTISNSYATGNVVGGSEVGGLVGKNTGNISYSYSVGSVSNSVVSYQSSVSGCVNYAINNNYSIIMRAYGDAMTYTSAWDNATARNILVINAHGSNSYIDIFNPNYLFSSMMISGGIDNVTRSYGPGLELFDATLDNRTEESWAVGIIGGKAAQIISAHNEYTVWDVRQHLRQISSFYDNTNSNSGTWTKYQGYGRPDLSKNVSSLELAPPLMIRVTVNDTFVNFTWRRFKQARESGVRIYKNSEIIYQGDDTKFVYPFYSSENVIFYVRSYSTDSSVIESRDETYSTFALNLTSLITHHPADTDQSGCISIGEISAYVGRWLNGNGVNIAQAGNAVNTWLNYGC